jgi:hypothetical protein
MEAKMLDGGIVPVLSLFTLLAVAVLALISKERTKDRMRDPNAPVSTLAKDGKFGGVAFLLPPDQLQPNLRLALARPDRGETVFPARAALE